ncbi:MAG: hypothetical protein EKK42_16690 [Pseudonocardiaceae bacterium]|nr:MAG: hypothetical protein EKK42_16690 [Pseudonocardiaceae bacterium]
MPLDLEALVLALLAKEPDARPSSAAEVYGRVTPHLDTSTGLRGAVSDATSALTLYSRVLGSAIATAQAEIVVPAALRRSELGRARAEATSLVRRSRPSEAADVLAALVGPAVSALGAADPEVLSLRFELADLRFDAGDYRAARPLYSALAGDLTDADLVHRCRRQEATCAVMTGDAGAATRLLTELLDQTRRAHGESDPRIADLQSQLDLLPPEPRS